MRWLCDEMLGRLSRLLRAAGYDTLLAEGGTADDHLLVRAQREGRIVLTCDRRLAEAAGADGFLVSGRTVEEQAHALSAAFRIDWLHAPFTRCLVDNTVVRPTSPAETAALPPKVRRLPGPFNACPSCGRLYWPGSHVRRLSARLERFACTTSEAH